MFKITQQFTRISESDVNKDVEADGESLLEKGNDDENDAAIVVKDLLADSIADPVPADDGICEASLPSADVPDIQPVADTAAEAPVAEKPPEEDDIVMLSDDEIDENGKLNEFFEIFELKLIETLMFSS